MPVIVGTNNSETLDGTGDADVIFGLDGDDTLNGLGGDDLLDGGAGDDTIFGDDGADTAFLDLSTGGSDTIDLGDGLDAVFTGGSTGQIRLTFTSAQVGNGDPDDSGDGQLNVRLQSEDGADGLTGPQSRIDDEGVTFIAAAGQRFDVRDTSGTQRGDAFEVVVLGTMGADVMTAVQAARPYYFNAGMGDDTVTGGDADDFLVGGGGNDALDGGGGNDSFIGGGGNDTITGGEGNDRTTFAVATDGADTVNLGNGNDVVNVTAAAGSQVRLTFTSSEVGNANGNDSNSMANQDGGLALRLQAEDGADGLTGPVSRFDDEGITFIASAGATFDVRDLVAGTQRGDAFEVVVLGTSGDDVMTAVQAARPYYFNAGMGNDSVTGGDANDFLVGGGGNDTLSGGVGSDSFIGGGGNDTIIGGEGNDRVTFAVATDGTDSVNLGAGADLVNVTAGAGSQVRLTFTSSEVGNGNDNDGNAMANQDGGLAVRLQAEDGADGLTGAVSRFDDEGITFVASAGATFDVRDLVAGTQRGDDFEVVALGTAGDDMMTAVQAARPYYFNAGMGNDTVIGGTADDFLVGGAGNDALVGGGGTDTFLGGGGNDTFYVETGETVIEAVGGGRDRIAALSSYVLNAGAEVELIEAINQTDTTDVDLTGNAFSQTIVGNAGSNVLSSGGGNDTLFGLDGDDFLYSAFFSASEMVGGAGNDTYYVKDTSDAAIESAGGGSDRVATTVSYTLVQGSEIEVLEAITLSDATDLDLTGNSLGQSVIGNAGNNDIDGRGGNDLLIGGNGQDSFAFTTALGAQNVDRIDDFSVADDTIALDDAIFTGMALGALSPNAFANGSQASDADDRIIYDQATGNLFFDADGSGTGSSAVLFATLSGAPVLTASDFIII